MTNPATPRRVDWLRVIQRGATLLRGLRGDELLGTDTEAARTVARGVREQLEQMGRAAVGCTGAASCVCPWCEERKKQQ